MSNGGEMQDDPNQAPIAGLNSLPTLSDAQLLRARHELYRRAYNELCEDVTGKAPSDEPPDEKEFIEQVRKFINERKDEYHEKVCKEFQWCKKRKENKWVFILAPALAEIAILVSSGGIAWSAGTIGWLATAELFDDLCECDK